MAGDARTAFLLSLALSVTLGPLFAHGLPRDDLYPYNEIGSSTLKLDDDGQLISTEVKLDTPISFYESVYNTIYVNGNGVLSFLAPMSRFFNIQFPLDYPTIAPLYTHVDTRGSGSIYYSETDSPDVISKAVDTIHRVFKDSQDFHPSHVFVATWEDVGYYDTKSDKVNTYQVAISSNGSHSYVEFLYPEKSIQWIQADFHPSGLPDAKAQAGVGARDGRVHTLKGSGTDQIQNIDKWSNVNNPGQWVLRVGPVRESENVQTPNNVRDSPSSNEIPSCLTGATSCHSKAECVDYSAGFCCVCKTGFFGNGKSCQQNDLAIRVTGKVSGFVNGEEFPSKDLQCYVQTKDGRTYTAMSRVPEIVGSKSQLLNNLGGVLGWLFAKPIEETKNGYQITGGVFNVTTEIIFTNTSDKLTIRSRYLGLDVFGQLKMETEIKGSLPNLADDARVEYEDHEELYTKTQPGIILSQSSRFYRVVEESDSDHHFTQNIVINYTPCQYSPDDGEGDTVKLKFSRGLTSYEAREQIIRFAMNTKIAPLEEEDPCIQGKSHCGDHSSCIVEGDDYKCVCNPGYQYLYEEDGSAHCVDVNECTAGTHACSPDSLCINNEGSHVCQCVEGFYGDGRTCDRLPSCEDTDCGEFSECNMIDGRPACSCAWGFERNEHGCYPVGTESCEDAACSLHAHCTMDQGFADCVCNVGFVGDGYSCDPETNYSTTTTTTASPELTGEPVPRCIANQCWCPEGWDYEGEACVKTTVEVSTVTPEENQTSSTTEHEGIEDLSCNMVNICHPYARCTYVAEEGGIYVCQCNAGYEGDGFECRKVEVTSCSEADICDPNASCQSSESSVPATCVCNPGYEGDGTTCTSIVSCNVANTCHPYAQCVFVPEEASSYVCQCSAGYEGDGFECKKTDVTCLEADICDPNASCQPVEPSGATCACNPGYEGDGTTCAAIDECRGHSECGEYEQCQYNQVTSRYTCTCISGYNRVDDYCAVADCSTDPGQCHLNAQCVSTTEGGYTCVCIPGYNGDGIHECISDHVGCNVIYNCGRNAACEYSQVTASYGCHCNSGFYGDGFTCLPESTCKRDPGLCSADASCVPAGENQYACVCNAGFTGNGVDCRMIPQYDSNILLLNQGMAMLRVPFFPTPDNPGSPISITRSQMAVALDVDCSGGRAYWSDVSGNRISSQTYNGSDAKVFIKDVGTPEGLAIDWISRNAFWTDSTKGTLEVANLDTQNRKVLLSEGLVNPRGIAAHPYRGKIFWSDWNRASPKLEWANEDGTQRAIFLQNEHVALPNSLAVDWSTDQLCWADAGTLSINCANIDRGEVQVIAKDLDYPFGLAISQNHYYWTDWKTEKIEIASKNSGERNKPLEIPPGGSGKLYGMVAVPEFCPRVSNVCQYDSGGCDVNQLCLPDGQGGRTCACADNIFEPCTDEYQSR